ncbi:MAG: UbiX family flavin prenyltransferase [Sphingobacteriia bacterium]|nr:UbiX family flavin prenyltransferase [Sphingobacteriia bacterium]
MPNKKLIVAITGASGAIYGIRILEILKDLNIETHLIISKSALITISSELKKSVNEIKELASITYQPSDIAAPIASGSFRTDGMIIAPCSIKTLAGIASCFSDSLITRAADVILKERRKLVLLLRETPLHVGHIEQMLKVSQMGGIIAPPVPAFYTNPNSIEEIVNHTVIRSLDLFDLNIEYNNRWKGLKV